MLSGRFALKKKLPRIETGQRDVLEPISSFSMPVVHPEPVSEDFNIVLLGSFNPAIFHPEWFVRHGLFSEDALETAKIDAITRDFAQFSLKSMRLTCDDARLTIAVASMAHVEMLFDALLGMLNLLSHLPITAVGMNNSAVFHLDSEERWHRIGHQLAPKDPVWNHLCEKPGMQSLSIQSPVVWSHPLLENLTVHPILAINPHHPAINVKTNLHFPIPSKTDKEAALTGTEYVAAFAKEMWKRATHRSREVAMTIFETIP